MCNGDSKALPAGVLEAWEVEGQNEEEGGSRLYEDGETARRYVENKGNSRVHRKTQGDLIQSFNALVIEEAFG